MVSPKFPIGTRIRSFWPGGKGLSKGWHFATLKAFHPNNRRFKYTVTWEADGKDSQRTELQIAPEVEPPGGAAAVAPLTILNRDHRALRVAFNNLAGMYAITAFPEQDIIKVGTSGNLGRRFHEYELYWIHLPIVIYAVLVLPSASISDKEERLWFHPKLRREGTPFAGRWRTANSTEWYKKSTDWDRIVSMLHEIEARHKGAGAFLTLAPGDVSVVPKIPEPRDVDKIIDNRPDKIHGGTEYKVRWKGVGKEQTWVSEDFFGMEGRSHAILRYDAGKKGAAELKKVNDQLKELAEKKAGVDREMQEQEHRIADQVEKQAKERRSNQAVRAAVRDRAFALAKLGNVSYPMPDMWKHAREE